MNKLLKTAFVTGVLAVVMTPLAFAQLGADTPLANISPSITDFNSLVSLLLRIAIAAAILWTLFNLIKAGIQYTGAGADAGKKKEALGSVISAVVGLVIVLLSLVILYFVGGFVGVNPDEASKTLGQLGPCTSSNGQERGVKVKCKVGKCNTPADENPNSTSPDVYCKLTKTGGAVVYEGPLK